MTVCLALFVSLSRYILSILFHITETYPAGKMALVAMVCHTAFAIGALWERDLSLEKNEIC